MNVRDFAVDQLAHQNLGTLTNGLRCVEYHAPFGVPPPTTSNGSVCDRLGKVWNRTTRRLEHDSMTPHKSDRFPGTHFQLSFVPGDSKWSSKGISPGMFIFIASFMCGVIYSVSESPAQLILARLPDGKITWAELHWFEAHGIGKKEIKLKQVL